MKISSLVDVVQGVLQNTPAISFITQSHTTLNKINDGDLFISSNPNDIYDAINNGAFAIVYDCNLNLKLLNNEIAFIKVSCINQACIKLLRFKLSTIKIKALSVNDVSFELFNLFKNSNNNFIYLDENISNNFELLYNTNNFDVLISKNKSFLNDIYPINEEFEIKKYDLYNLVVHSLFETSFSFKNRYFSKLKLPMIYIDNFISVIEYLDISEVDTSKLKNFKFMQAIFINKSNEIIDFGKSNRFLIANSCSNINFLEVAFMKKFYCYAKVKIIDENITNNDEIYNIIKSQDYNALYIKSKTKKQIIELLNSKIKDTIKLF